MQPELLRATELAGSDQGEWAWDPEVNSYHLDFTPDHRTVKWVEMPVRGIAPPIWIPVQSRAKLHSGLYSWDFTVRDMGKGQIGVGFMLMWNVGPDWGFYGYLGSSSSAWAYDPSSGDVVVDTRSIQGGLPTFPDGENGIVTVEADLPRIGRNFVRFVVNGVSSHPVELPEGSVITPAACFLKYNQVVTLSPLRSR